MHEVITAVFLEERFKKRTAAVIKYHHEYFGSSKMLCGATFVLILLYWRSVENFSVSQAGDDLRHTVEIGVELRERTPSLAAVKD